MGIPKGVSPEVLIGEIRQKQEDLKELHTKVGEARGLMMGEEKSLEAEISRLSGQINMIETEIKAFNLSSEEAELKRLLSEKNALDEEISRLEGEFHLISVEIASLEAVAREKEAILVRLKKFTGLCPLFKEEISCKTEEVLAAVQERKENASLKEEGKIQELQDNRIKRKKSGSLSSKKRSATSLLKVG